VLFLHGILGTPHHFDFLLPYVPESWSLWSLLLPGHGGSCGDFGRSSMAEWEDAVEEALDELRCGHDRIFLVGHSMGTLLAVRAAAENPEKIAGIFALAMPLKIGFTAKAAMASLHVAFRPADKDSPFLRTSREATGVALSKNPLAYAAWIPRFLELFHLSREVRGMMTVLPVPCLALQSARDELVSPASLKYIFGAKAVVLPDSSHYFYNTGDRETIIRKFQNYIH